MGECMASGLETLTSATKDLLTVYLRQIANAN
jgi:hypothetical protein